MKTMMVFGYGLVASLSLLIASLIAIAPALPAQTTTPAIPVYTITITGATVPTPIVFTTVSTQNCFNTLSQDSAGNNLFLDACVGVGSTTTTPPPVVTPPPTSTPGIVQSAFNATPCNFGVCGPVAIKAATAGNKLVVELINGDTGEASCADNLGNALTEQAGSPQVTISGAGGGAQLHELAYIVPSGGPTSVTCKFAGSFAETGIFEVQGSPGAAVMQAFSLSAFTSGNCTPSPTVKPTASPAIAFGVYYADLVSTAAGAGWTAIGTVSTNGAPMFVEWQLQTSTSPAIATLSANACAEHGPDAFMNLW